MLREGKESAGQGFTKLNIKQKKEMDLKTIKPPVELNFTDKKECTRTATCYNQWLPRTHAAIVFKLTQAQKLAL